MSLKSIRKILSVATLSMGLALALSTNVLAAAEKEPNNSASRATAFAVTESAEGTISASNDEDWYSFTLSAPSSVSLSLAFKENISSTYRLNLQLFDDTQSIIYMMTDFSGGSVQATDYFNLAPGTYYVEIKDANLSANHPYVLSVDAQAVAANTESESNDTAALATALTLNQKEFGQLSNYYDADWYKFTVAKPGAVSITFDHTYYGLYGQYWSLDFYSDANAQNLIYSCRYQANERNAITGDDFYVGAGTYYICVRRSDYYSPFRYGVTVNYTDSEAVNGEKEDNNIIGDANKINTGVTYVGNLSTDKDTDWYSFTVPQSEKISVEFSNDGDYSGNTWDVTLYTDVQSTIFTKSTGSAGFVSDQKTLSKGTYYIKVTKSSDYSSSTYRITVNSETTSYYIPGKDCKWANIDGKAYWYEGGYRQGTYEDPKGVRGDGTVRGREIFDPASNAWYWLDANASGAKAVGKEVWMPYVYQNEANWSRDEMIKIANESDEGMAQCVLDAMLSRSGKWVRYDENGRMLKGWVHITGALADKYPNQRGNIYYYDTRTGLMARGWVKMGGHTYYFDPVTGVNARGIVTIDGKQYYFTEGEGYLKS